MISYLLRRLFLLPLTLLAILFVNFVIINLAPGDPSLLSQISPTGDGTRQAGKEGELGREDQYLLFREHYGLTLPILWNRWPSISREWVLSQLNALVTRRAHPDDRKEMGAKQYNGLRISFGDRSRYLMPLLLAIAQDPSEPLALREMAVRFFVRGGMRNGFLGRKITAQQRLYNQKVAADNQLLRQLRWAPTDSDLSRAEKLLKLESWYAANRDLYRYEPSPGQRLNILFLETRLYRYFSRVLALDFGTMRNDANRMVIAEVGKRLKVSLTIAVVPMLITFVLCQLFGFLMALKQNRWQDVGLNLFFLILYATPVFVVAPFLIEKIALHHTFPFTELPVPTSGFHGPDADYLRMTSNQRLLDIAMHLFLPLIAVMYGSIAVQARLSRTAVLEVTRQDYVRTARAKGLPPFTVVWKHVGRNAAITIVTSLAASLGVILGGSLIVETIFGIDGFGRFFYEAILNRDYNVIMFSALAGSLLALLGYLLADIAYTFLDPRVTLEGA